MEECLIVTWTRDGHPAMQYAAACADAEAAGRVFRRLSDVLRELVHEEARKEG